MNRNDVMFSENLPPDVAPVAAALETLAARDRAAAPAGLADRVYRASLPSLRMAEDEQVVYAFPKARPTTAGRGLAMAAGLALLATVGSVWLAGQRPAPSTETAALTDTEVDALLTLADVSDATTGDSVDKIAADAENVARAVSESWMPDDLFSSSSDESNGESM